MRAFGMSLLLSAGLAVAASPAFAGAVFFSTGDPDGRMAATTREPTPGKFEIETADDFVLDQTTAVTSASFIGLIPTGVDLSSIAGVDVEIYRIFPQDSDTGRTPNVPTRTNSPSDVALDGRATPGDPISFSAKVVNPSFTAANSVRPGGIHPSPGFQTGGDGQVTGQEIEIDVDLSGDPFVLTKGHYFFRPELALDLPGDDFMWLSAPKPIAAPGTPFLPDLQAWTRDEFLAPDWLRIGTDIVGGGPPPPTFNMTFSLSGVTVPEPAVWTTMMLGLFGLGAALRRRRASVA